jgi:hypothetical protein
MAQVRFEPHGTTELRTKNPTIPRLASPNGGAGTEKRQNYGNIVSAGVRPVNATFVVFPGWARPTRGRSGAFAVRRRASSKGTNIQTGFCRSHWSTPRVAFILCDERILEYPLALIYRWQLTLRGYSDSRNPDELVSDRSRESRECIGYFSCVGHKGAMLWLRGREQPMERAFPWPLVPLRSAGRLAAA